MKVDAFFLCCTIGYLIKYLTTLNSLAAKIVLFRESTKYFKDFNLNLTQLLNKLNGHHFFGKKFGGVKKNA